MCEPLMGIQKRFLQMASHSDEQAHSPSKYSTETTRMRSLSSSQSHQSTSQEVYISELPCSWGVFCTKERRLQSCSRLGMFFLSIIKTKERRGTRPRGHPVYRGQKVALNKATLHYWKEALSAKLFLFLMTPRGCRAQRAHAFRLGPEGKQTNNCISDSLQPKTLRYYRQK